MKMRILSTAVVVAIAISSCRKNVSDDAISTGTDPMTIKAQTWLDYQNKNLSSVAQKSAIVSIAFKSFKPQWSKISYSSIFKTGIIPLALENRSSGADKALAFLVVKNNDAGEINDGRYCFVLSKGAAPEVNSEVLSGKVPLSFTGAIVNCSIDGTLISAKHYKNGSEASGEDVITIKEQSGSGASGGQNIVPVNCDGGQTTCIDWYWQTYEDGVLIYEEYLYTTCECQGGSGNGGSTSNCGDMTQSQVATLLSSINGEEMHSVSTVHGGMIINEETGKIERNNNPEWMFLKQHIALWYTVYYKAYFMDRVYKNSTNDFWKWQTISFSQIARSSGSLPPCMVEEITSQTVSAPIISPDKKTAETLLSCTIKYHFTITWGSADAATYAVSNVPQTFAAAD